MKPSFVLLFSTFLASSAAFAQTPPSAGQILQQVTPPTRVPAPALPRTTIEETVPATTENSQAFLVRGFRITGNTVFSEAELLALIGGGSGQQLGLRDLNDLADKLTWYYREAGYPVARAYLPAQDVRDGIVNIAILEGRIEAVRVNNVAGIAANALAPLERMVPGEVVRNEAIEGGLLRLADVPGIEVKSTLRPGQAVGTSEFLIDVTPGSRLNGFIDADNFGNRYTGANRLGASLNWNNPGNLGDQLTLRGQVSDENFNYGRLGYQLPVGSWGTRIGIAWSTMRYRLSKDFAALDADGTASIGSLYLQHPLLRSRQASWYAALQFDDKELTDWIGATDTRTDKHLQDWSLGLYGNFADGLGGSGRNSASLMLTGGKLALDEVTAASDAVSARSRGGFRKVAASYQRLQQLPGSLILSLSLNGQWADSNLDSSEKFMLGGAQGVRAYPQGEGSGDEGHLLNLELRYPLEAGWDIQGFYDDGRVKINRNPWTQSTNSRHLAGYGVGAGYGDQNVSLRFFVAWRSEGAKPTADQDRNPRIWLQGGYSF